MALFSSICGIDTNVIGKVVRGFHLYTFCTILGIGRNLDAFISLGMDISPSIENMNFRSDINELTSLIKYVEIFNLCKLHNKPECRVVSQAFSVSNNTAVIDRRLIRLNSEGI
jgi:hypothetical protein